MPLGGSGTHLLIPALGREAEVGESGGSARESCIKKTVSDRWTDGWVGRTDVKH